LTAGAPKPTRDELVEKLVQSCRILYREVRSVQNPDPIGHFSARVPGTEEILIKPRDVGWNRVTADDIVTFDLKYRRLSGPEYEIIELPIHVEMYKSREDVMAVVHTHQTYATLMGTLGLKLELLDHNTLAFAGGVPVYDESIDPTYFSPKFRTLIREERQGQILARKMGGANAIILKAHGPVIVGRSVEEACMATVALENAAKAQIIAAMVRGQGEPIEGLGVAGQTPSAGRWRALVDSYR
jgi:L-ribulose-5-phosphate 4-epimerase